MSKQVGILRSLYNKNFRLYFSGQAISMTGTWMQRIGMSWLAYRLTGSALLLGLVSFTGDIPNLLLSPITGVIADRYNRHHILLITQTLAMIQAIILAVLTLTHVINIWHLLVLALFLGIINYFDSPVRQSFIIQMVASREDLTNAIALNSFLFNGGKLVGPALAGILIAVVGEGMCFLLNGMSYLFIIWGLMAMNITPLSIAKSSLGIWEQLKEGLHYTYECRSIRNILLFRAFICLVGLPYEVLLPVLTSEVFRGSANTMGFLVSAVGVGAVSGVIYLATRRNIAGLEKLATIASTILGISIICLSMSHYYYLSLMCMGGIGFGIMAQMTTTNTFIQMQVRDDQRGRVMSLYILSLGIMPFGSLAAGAMAGRIGSSYTLLIMGILCLLGTGVYACRRRTAISTVAPL